MQQTTLSHDVINSLEDALDSKNNSGSKSDSPFLQAHVLRTDDDGTTWVHIIGGVRETPVNGGSITSVKNKDLVLVNVSDGKCSIIGNLTSPSSDDSVAIDAKKTAIAASKNTRDAQEQIKIASKVANSALENLFTDMQVWTTEIKGTNPSTNPNVWTLTKPTSIRAGIQMWSATKRVYNNGIIELHDIVPYTGIVSQTTYFYQTIIPDGDSAPKTPVGVEPEGWLQTPPALPVDEASEEDANSNIYSSVRTFYGDGSYRWSTPSKNGFASTWINNTYVLQSVKSQTTANTENITKQSTSITQNSEAIELNAKTIKSVQDSTQANASDLATYILNQTKTNESLQSQIDGSIETWFYEVPPTSENEPASNWTTTDLKNNHLGDLYYDTKTGYCYRYQVINNEYSWQRITDVDVTKALADAKNAQDTADNKRRIFTVTPIPPYDKGDLWVQGSTGDILVCQSQKPSREQSYDETDWVLASKYTDDSYAETKFTETSEKIEAQAKKIDENGTKIATLTETADGITQTVESHYTELTEYKTSNDTAVSEAKNIATTAKSTAETADSNASTAVSTAKTAASDAANAVKTANAASSSAASAVETANSASSTASAASTTASKASTDAAEAVKTANTANGNASSAVTTANGAVTTANAASSTANAAKTTAEGAASTASSAKSVADSASSTAKAASTSASNAVSTAQTAKSTADTAKSTADAAKSSAATANNTANAAKTAAGNAQSTANTAVTNAAKAQSTADGAAKQANLYTIDNGDAGPVPKWIHLGTLTSAGDASSATIAVSFGNGYNGQASQNSALTITIKDGAQPRTGSPTRACGVTAMRENCDDALVDVLAQNATVYDVWVYAPWEYSRGSYSISGQYAAWQHSGATQKTEPATSATQVKQDVAYRLADATKAQTMATDNRSSIRQLSDSIKMEVTERGKLAGRVGTLESTANDVDKRLKSVESDYVTSATLNTTKESIEADISSTLTESKKYTDDSITTEVTNRNAAITAKADEINSSVEKTYITKDDAQNIYSTKTELDQTAETISSSVSKKVSIGENGTVSDLSSVMEQSADGVLVKFSKTVGEQTFQPAIELTTDSDYDNASTVNAAIKMWESLSIRNSGGTPVTEINGPTMKINKVVVVDSIRIGTWLLASRSETTTSGSSEIIEIRSI